MKLEDKKIGFCALDPIHNLVSYTVDNEIFIMDKNCEKYQVIYSAKNILSRLISPIKKI